MNERLPSASPQTIIIALLTSVLAFLAVSSRPGPRKTRRVVALLVKFVYYYFLMLFEEKIYRNLLRMKLDIPRNMDELLSEPEYYLFDKLRSRPGSSPVPSDARFVKAERLNLIETEPDKNATAGSLRLVYRLNDGQEVELKVFAKFQSGRGLPRWLQAVRAAAEPQVCREIDFYNKVRREVSPGIITTPACYLCEKRPRLNYIFAAIEHVDLGRRAKVVTDWQGASVPQIEAMMDRVVRLHTRYLGVFEDDVSVSLFFILIPPSAGR